MQYKNINFTELNNMKKLRKFSSKFQLQNAKINEFSKINKFQLQNTKIRK